MKRTLIAVTAWAAVMSLVAVGCGSMAAPGPVGRRPGAHPGRTHSAPTEAGNRKLARAAAARLLALAPLPSHSQRLRTALRALPGPAMGTPAAGSVIDDARSWRVDLPFAAAIAWLAADRPAGLRRTGSVGAAVSGPANSGRVRPVAGGISYSGPVRARPVIAGYSYAGSGRAAWGSAQLDVAVAPDGKDFSVLRADGLAVWLDPVPIKDSAPGKRLQVRLAAGCPASDAGVAGVRDPGPALTRSLLPPGQPDAALRCLYFGLNGRPFRLREQQRLDAARARALAVSILAKPVSHPIRAQYMCPMDDGSAELVVFAYPGRPNVDIWVHLNGCGGVLNGYHGLAGTTGLDGPARRAGA